MPLWLLDPDNPDFPPAETAAADPDGLLALGGDYSVPRLLAAYSSGIFPWSVWRGRITWHSPDPRFVLLRENFRIPHTLRRILKKNPYRITIDRAFPDVIAACARAGSDKTASKARMTLFLPHLVSCFIFLFLSGDILRFDI